MPTRSVKYQYEVTENGSLPVDLLAGATGLSKQRIKTAMQYGAVWLERQGARRRIRRVKSRLHVGDKLHIYYDEAILTTTPSQPTLIADANSYSLWFKPMGMPSQGSKWGDHCAINRWIEQHLTPQRPAFLVHRLDRAARGIMLIAHTKGSAASLSRQFQQRTISKYYQAIVKGLAPQSSDGWTISEPIEGREAISQVWVVARDTSGERSLVKVKIETGRKHQIRRHLASKGYPIVGDRLYGQGDTTRDLQLCAYSIGFQDPTDTSTRVYRIPDNMLLEF